MPCPMFLSVFGFCQKRKLAEAKENWSSPSTFNLFVSLPKPQSQQQLWSDLSSWEVHLEGKWHFLPDAGKQTQLRFGWTRWQPELSPDYKDVEIKFTPLPAPWGASSGCLASCPWVFSRSGQDRRSLLWQGVCPHACAGCLRGRLSPCYTSWAVPLFYTCRWQLKTQGLFLSY